MYINSFLIFGQSQTTWKADLLKGNTTERSNYWHYLKKKKKKKKKKQIRKKEKKKLKQFSNFSKLVQLIC